MLASSNCQGSPQKNNSPVCFLNNLLKLKKSLVGPFNLNYSQQFLDKNETEYLDKSLQNAVFAILGHECNNAERISKKKFF